MDVCVWVCAVISCPKHSDSVVCCLRALPISSGFHNPSLSPSFLSPSPSHSHSPSSSTHLHSCCHDAVISHEPLGCYDLRHCLRLRSELLNRWPPAPGGDVWGDVLPLGPHPSVEAKGSHAVM